MEVSGDCASYFPLSNGRYEVKPGMMLLGCDLGNGDVDQRVFQIDSSFTQYRHIKLFGRRENLAKYYQTCNLSDNVRKAIANLMMMRLSQEYPQYFDYQHLFDNTIKFESQLTGEVIYLDSHFELLWVEGEGVFPDYICVLDAIATQIQEDFTVICRGEDGSNWLSAVHLCFPNHWSAQEKIGKDFAAIHAPVAGIEKINRRSAAIVNTMITREPMVRFAWGLSTDTRLNHHPEPATGVEIDEWVGRNFDEKNPQLYLRIERQVMWGLPEREAALFTIRTYFRDCQEIKKDNLLRSKLISAIESMTPESLVYKGLIESKGSILQWLNDF